LFVWFNVFQVADQDNGQNGEFFPFSPLKFKPQVLASEPNMTERYSCKHHTFFCEQNDPVLSLLHLGISKSTTCAKTNGYVSINQHCSICLATFLSPKCARGRSK